MKKYILIFLIFIIFSGKLFSQSCCGGSFYDLAVLSLDKKALFNIGYNYESFQGNWDEKGKWNNINYTSYQVRPLFASAYRFNKSFQAGVSIPFVFNRSELPGLPPTGSSIGDISISGRYEIFHEFQRYKINQRFQSDTKTPYLAITAGFILPTGKSDETALTEAEITGKGFYTTSLGLSALKSIVQNKFQVALDLNYQHSFTKTYSSYNNIPLQTSYTKNQGDRFNYALSLNYLVNVRHALSVSFSGFRQGDYGFNGTDVGNSNENGLSFMGSYTYYPMPVFRVTPSFKWFLPNDNIAKNTTGSYLFAVNLVYYLEY